MRHSFIKAWLAAMLFMAFTAQAVNVKDGSEIQPDNYYPRVKMVTTMGDFIVELDRRKAPITVNNFLRYAALRSYEDTIFHRIVPEFVVQGGGYTEDFKVKPTLDKIFNESGNGLTNDYYTIAMARETDPHSATRQFYVNLNDNESLNPGRNWGYTVFGYVTEGTDVIDAMGAVETEYSVGLMQPNVPVKPIILQKVEILPAQY
jgi:peptidyl-prolyl cis-trans isomerase A (cyclophilin A)